jgi:hypothetical protein
MIPTSFMEFCCGIPRAMGQDKLNMEISITLFNLMYGNAKVLKP